MASRNVTLGIDVEVDAARAASGFDDVSRAARDMANDVDRATRDADRSAGSMADSVDDLGSKSSQAAGGIGDLGGALALMPGPLGAVGAGMEAVAPAIMGVTGAADLMSLAMNSNAVANVRAKVASVGSTIATKAQTVATKAATVAQRALNLVMRLNPIGLVVTAVTLLVAGFVVLYKRSATVRRIVDQVWQAVKTAGRWIADTAVKVGKFLLKWSPMGVAVRLVRDNFGQVKDRLVAAGKWIADTAVKVGKFLAKWSPMGVAVRTVRDNFGQVTGKLGDLWRMIRNNVLGQLGKLREKAGSVGGWFRDTFGPIIDGISDAFGSVRDAVSSLVGWLGKIKIPSGLSKLGDAVGGLFSGSAPLTLGQPRLMGGVGSLDPRRGITAGLATAAAGDGWSLLRSARLPAPVAPTVLTDQSINIRVEGAVDSAGVADQIIRLIRRRGRQLGVDYLGGTGRRTTVTGAG